MAIDVSEGVVTPVVEVVESLLDGVRCPADLRALPATALPALAEEIRRRLIATVSRTGGHLGPNLGVVELTLALHRVFDSPRDAIVWDTGHQSYVHKMLTGRAAALPSLRQAGGLSGYPRRAESEHDLVENSHASTALSYADGLAKAFALRGEPHRAVVAVVGDGALTGGMCWEALNNIGGAVDRPVIVVLNDNGRSYSPTVGVIGAHLAGLRSGTAVPALTEALGLAYLGPVDGHDTGAVEEALAAARAKGVPVLVHCITRKGKGYPAAEAEEFDRMHTVSPSSRNSRRSWTDVLGEELAELAGARADLVAVTAAMLHPTGLGRFARAFPDRVFDVGIAEQHAVTSAAGLALGGLHPVVCLYATFLNRAFDQVLMDVALHRLPVTFVLDRAGITGSDGPSHNGMWDLSLLGIVPGMHVAAPRDGQSLRTLLREAVELPGPSAIRFPKADVAEPVPAVGRIGRADVLRDPPDADVLLIVAGPLADAALAAAEELAADGVRVRVADPRWLLPVDPALAEAAARHRLTVTVEDGGVAGGFGDALARAARAVGAPLVRTVGLAQEFLDHGSRGALLAEHGLDAREIARQVREALPPR
ncbi:1-deoxy-D-xylulose-5-phosphate synthase [Dactylosporangium sp. CA-092794]|uniref:1-deoxy-D-xylulose-5-phosphate synthase n=1 Tax=Dactylosporangium sp. CA-092794 TaxID=3239929 RepID=UPI003D9441C5